MKTYKITVNGNTYEVGVEEVGGAPEVMAVQAAPPTPRPAPAPKPAPTPKAAPAPAPAPKAAAPAPAPKAAPASGGEDVLAPMPGKVISINVSEGAQVKSGQLLLVFEAMKMENELFAPVDGTVTKIHVEKGAALEAGEPVITIS